jgi:putative DNA methylase
MTPLPKRLIEVDLPIRRISEHARREKSIRHGHISTLHIWWARRPLAACRAVLCASLWPDPADPHCPEAFVDTARKAMLAWTPHARQEKLSAESRERFNAARKDRAVFDSPEELRMALLDFIADFANWDNSTDADYLATARTLTQSAHEALGGLPGTRPLVVDPFAGGGSIPLEALRVGGDAFASDLNPIPVLLNKVILEYIPKYGRRLADEVRKWGQWIKEEAEKELAEFYPKDDDGATPIAYLWARTILSEDPGGGEIPVEVPLMRSLWLSKKPGNRKALRWKRTEGGAVECETLEVAYANGTTVKARRPLLEIFTPESEREVEDGTAARGSATCPVTGYTTPVASVRKQMKARKGGAADARLFCVVTTKPGQQGRFYRLPTVADHEATIRAAEELERRKAAHTGALSLVPDELTPRGGGSGAGRAFSQRNYGMEHFGDLFTPRQLLALTTLVRLSRQAGEEIRKSDDAELANAVVTGLAVATNRLADRSSCLCRWDPTPTASGIINTFSRQVMPMVWDFAEGLPLESKSGGWLPSLEWIARVAEHDFFANQPATVCENSAVSHPLPDDTAQCFFSDPPYYDAVPYSDLSDFFYVWFKRTLGDRMPDLFSEELAPKGDECIVDEVKGKDRAYFEEMMGKAMAEGCRILARDGIGCIVFAHKSTAGWEAQLQAMVDAGWTMTASWPIDTEMGSRLRAMNSAALASSVHLVVRPRIVNGHGAVGDWRDVLDELPKRIHAWLPRLAEEGVVGADAIFACLGPALEIFSRYDRVEKASGEQVTLREYLEQVWAAVSREALSTVVADADLSGFEADARLTAMWLWTVAGGSAGKDGGGESKDESRLSGTSLRSGEDEEGGRAEKAGKVSGFTLEYDAARKIAQGLGAHLDTLRNLVDVKGDKATLLPVAGRTEYLFGKGERAPETAKGRKKASNQMELFAELVEAGAADAVWEEKTVSKPGETVLDRVHQAMILFASGRGEALKRFLVDDGAGQDPALWKLAQAFSALYPPGTQEKRWVDGVLARKKGLGL